jgi:hypothetical protein
MNRVALCVAALGLILVACGAYAEDAPGAEKPNKPGAAQVELPGIKIDAKNKRIDIDAKVSLDDGLLEVIACIRDSREHESIIVVDAVPVHIHTALLLIGAENGHPAMVKPANEEKTEWLRLPPRGDPISVSLVYPDPENKDKSIERPISDFIKRAEGDPALEKDEEEMEDPAKVFDTFVFAGSILRQNEKGERQYLADVNGNVVSISTFGDEVLCLPAQISQDNAALVWSVNSKHLPAVGTKVKLRLTLKEKPKDPEAE